MAGGLPITPERILEELHDATYVTSLCLQPTEPRFARFLRQDPEFARVAHATICVKIDELEGGGHTFANPGGRSRTIKGWERALKIIETKSGIAFGDATPLTR